MNHPRLVVAAPGSGHGKTTVATGLLAAFRRRGLDVAPFKVGPDYIDPGYHRIASGRPGRNLDPVLVGEDNIAGLFRHGSADLAIVEGVLGLFDGRLSPAGSTADWEGVGFGSTAHVAELLEAPVVLVVDASGQGQSLAALLHGFRCYRPQVRIAGVLLNRVGSRRHEEVLRAAADSVGLPVLGAIPRGAELSVPSRHLGLITAAEHGERADRAVRAMADAVEASTDLDAVLAQAGATTPVTAPPWAPDVQPVSGRPLVGIAGGPAFSFGYAEHAELLTAAGAEVAVIDPLRDERLPADTAGLVLPGGFPEQHVAELAANRGLRADIAALAARGAPVHAECGGLLYLAEELDGHPLCGVLPARAAMSPALTLGYRDAVAATGSVLFDEGQRVSGHEFHRTVLTPRHGTLPAWRWRGGADGFVHAGVHASYLHTHPVAMPESVVRFVRRCRR